MQPPFPFRAAAWLAALSGALHAQGSGFTSPGMPGTASSGQSLMFASEYNPSISLTLDAVADVLEADDPSVEDGGDVALRSAEIGIHSWIDPSAWAYAYVVYAEDELGLEEGAVIYNGLGGNTSLKAGRFFLDFGKQMQAHPHELRTVERPAVLRTFLGEELHADGLELGNWFSAGDETVVRYSFGVYRSLLSEEERYGGGALEPLVPDRFDLDELSYAARITGLSEVGELGSLQLGLSARHVGEFGYEDPGMGLSVTGLSNTVYGADVTYGHRDETATRGWAAGVEVLVHDGDFGAEAPGGSEGTGLQTSGGTRSGYFAWVDWQRDRYRSLGLQVSGVELLEPQPLDLTEVDVYWTRYLSDFQRLRVGVTAIEDDLDGDAYRLAVQYTNVIGPHSHGVDW